MDVATVLTSAAVGAIVAEAIHLLGAAQERRSRREELLLSRALDLAEQRIQLGKELAFAQKNVSALFPQAVILAAEYYQHLRHLLETGKLPADYLERNAEDIRRQGGG